jgi:hypothetical protein
MEIVVARTASRRHGPPAAAGLALFEWTGTAGERFAVVAENETQARAVLVAAIVLPGLFALTFDADVALLVAFVNKERDAEEAVLRRAAGNWRHSSNFAFAQTVCREAPLVTTNPVSLVFEAARDKSVVIGGERTTGTSRWRADAPRAGAADKADSGCTGCDDSGDSS